MGHEAGPWHSVVALAARKTRSQRSLTERSRSKNFRPSGAAQLRPWPHLFFSCHFFIVEKKKKSGRVPPTPQLGARSSPLTLERPPPARREKEKRRPRAQDERARCASPFPQDTEATAAPSASLLFAQTKKQGSSLQQYDAAAESRHEGSFLYVAPHTRSLASSSGYPRRSVLSARPIPALYGSRLPPYLLLPRRGNVVVRVAYLPSPHPHSPNSPNNLRQKPSN